MWILGGIGGVVFLCCGGGFWFVSWGLSLVTDEVRDLVARNPAVVAEVGTVESFRMEVLKSCLDEDEDLWYYRVAGSKARGTLAIRHVTDAEGREVIRSIRFTGSDGRVVDLPADTGPPESP